MLAVMLANKTPAGAVLSCLNSHSPYCIRVIHHHLRSQIPSVQGNPHIAGLLLQMANDKFEPGSLLLWQLTTCELFPLSQLLLNSAFLQLVLISVRKAVPCSLSFRDYSQILFLSLLQAESFIIIFDIRVLCHFLRTVSIL